MCLNVIRYRFVTLSFPIRQIYFFTTLLDIQNLATNSELSNKICSLCMLNFFAFAYSIIKTISLEKTWWNKSCQLYKFDSYIYKNSQVIMTVIGIRINVLSLLSLGSTDTPVRSPFCRLGLRHSSKVFDVFVIWWIDDEAKQF